MSRRQRRYQHVGSVLLIFGLLATACAEHLYEPCRRDGECKVDVAGDGGAMCVVTPTSSGVGVCTTECAARIQITQGRTADRGLLDIDAWSIPAPAAGDCMDAEYYGADTTLGARCGYGCCLINQTVVSDVSDDEAYDVVYNVRGLCVPYSPGETAGP